MKNILVTGGAGFIGANFILHMLDSNPKVNITNYDALTYAADLDNLKEAAESSQYKFIKGDINECDRVAGIIRENGIDLVVNFAAESHVDRAIQSADEFAKTNIMGTLCLLQACEKAWEGKYRGRRFVQISTDEVYGSAGKGVMFDEESVLKPGNPYAASKASADLMCLSWHNTYGFPVVITRSANNYGRFQHEEKFIPTVIKNSLLNTHIPIYGDGQNMRDWICVEDNVRAIKAAAIKGKIGSIYNISAHNYHKNIDLARRIIDIINEETELNVSYDLLTFVKNRKGHDFKYSTNSDKAKDELGFEASCEFAESLRNTVLWYIGKFDALNIER